MIPRTAGGHRFTCGSPGPRFPAQDAGSLVPAPAFALRLMLGETADALILSGQRVLPAKATLHGFEFRYPDLESALRAIYVGP